MESAQKSVLTYVCFNLFLRLIFSVKFSAPVPLKGMSKNEFNQKVMKTIGNWFRAHKMLFQDKKIRN